MNRDQWKTLFEGVGILAIVASLIFVGIETRNSTRQAELNTQAIEIASYQELMSNVAELNRLTVENADVAKLILKAWNTDEVLSPIEEFRFGRNAFMRFRHGDMAFFQYQRGTISEERLLSALKPLNLSNRRVQQFWEPRQGNFVEPYRNYINALIDEVNQRN